MAQIITTYLIVILLVSLGFFGVGALASAQELVDPMQPPAFSLQKNARNKMGGESQTSQSHGSNNETGTTKADVHYLFGGA